MRLPLAKGPLSILACLLCCILTIASQAATEYVEGDVIVTFKPSATEAAAKSVLDRKSLPMSHRFGWLSAKRGRQTGLIRHKSKSTAELITELKDDPAVETVEPNYRRWVKASPNDSRFSEMWGLHNTGQAADGVRGTSGDDIKFPEAWNLARVVNNEIVVGVIDTGVDYIHPDLRANMWTNSAESRKNSDDDSDGYFADYYGYDFSGITAAIPHPPDPADSGYHGTHVAGTIAATGNNATGTIGVNFRAKIMALKVSNDGDSIDTSAVIEALQYATMMKNRGVNIVALNASYGGGGYSSAESAAIQAAGNAGIILCAAAGNESSNNDTTPVYPANYRLSNMIVVAASDQNDALADFSNYGTKVDIAAPGTNILSLEPSTVTFKLGTRSYAAETLSYASGPTEVSGKVVDCNYGDVGDFPAAVNGNIALIQRGSASGAALYFSDKVANAMAAGAKAVILYNNVSDTTTYPFLGSLQNPGQWIPSLFVLRNDGLAIKNALTATPTGSIVITGNYQYLEGTSMATPHVTGAVAFAAMNFPKDTVAQRITRILNAADSIPGLSQIAGGRRLNLLNIVDKNANGMADWLEQSTPQAPSITSAPILPGAAVSSHYTEPLAATGGTTPYTWTLLSGSLPPGLTLSTSGEISGTPTAAGSYGFAIQVADNSGGTSGLFFSLNIAATPLAIVTTANLPEGVASSAYSTNLQAAGGTATSYTWTILSGAPPDGLTLSTAGVLSGTPVAVGTFHFTAQVTDAGNATNEQTFTIVINPVPLVISTPSPLAVGAVAVDYSQPLTATGGTGARIWSISEGALPPGLQLGADGVISGSPSAAGVFTFNARVTDSAAITQEKPLTLTIEETGVTITTGPALIAGVKSLAYKQTFTATGGSGSYTWARTSGALPPGMQITTAGVLSGTPTVPGGYSFTLTVRDSIGYTTSQEFALNVTATYVKPVVDVIDFGSVTVGVPYSKTVTATNYPKTFSITHLPPGITYAAATGLISGRPTTAGTYDIQVKATNPGGVSNVFTSALIVKPIPSNFVGSFIGVISRDSTANANLGGRLTLTTTARGNYTVKITIGATSKSAVGYLADTAPHISIPLGAATLNLTLDEAAQLATGSHGAASVSGWRSTWTAAHPATHRAGYYTIGIDLADEQDKGLAGIPQGSGYAAFTVTATSGALTVAGKTADGSAFTSAGFIGPEGQIAIYSPLYANLGSLLGELSLTEDTNAPPLENTASGPLTWLKPATKTRTYAAGFGPLHLSAYGKYLAVTSAKGIAAGLPATGLADVIFTDGGIELSATQPDISPFTYTATKTVSVPKAGLTGNLGKATLAINKATGLVGGAFTLVETSPPLTRRVTYQGMIVRPESGDIKAIGYFLLPQIPGAGQTINTSPILSGRVTIDQPVGSQ